MGQYGPILQAHYTYSGRSREDDTRDQPRRDLCRRRIRVRLLSTTFLLAAFSLSNYQLVAWADASFHTGDDSKLRASLYYLLSRAENALLSNLARVLLVNSPVMYRPSLGMPLRNASVVYWAGFSG